jgi:mannose-6-phosphate isomerase
MTIQHQANNESLTPMKLSPVFLEKIWGGQALSKKLNKNIPQNAKIGESWEISGIEPYESKISNGILKGRSISDLCKEYRDKLLGDSPADTNFPLLYKFIDANDRLSVQVHPDDHQASIHKMGPLGKTECWFIVDAPADAKIIVGLKKSISKDEMLSSIHDGSFKNLLNEEPVVPGDLLFIPADTIHAIMSDTLIYEVQESSDITLRVYDWDRVDDSGTPRQLHIEDAVKITDTKAYGSFKIAPVHLQYATYTHSFRVACRYFAIEQYSIHNTSTIVLPVKKSFQVITLINGSITLIDSNTSMNITNGESVLIPASCSNLAISSDTPSEFLLSSVPDLQNEIIVPLIKNKISKDLIAQLGGIVPERNDLLQLIDKLQMP